MIGSCLSGLRMWISPINFTAVAGKMNSLPDLCTSILRSIRDGQFGGDAQEFILLTDAFQLTFQIMLDVLFNHTTVYVMEKYFLYVIGPSKDRSNIGFT